MDALQIVGVVGGFSGIIGGAAAVYYKAASAGIEKRLGLAEYRISQVELGVKAVDDKCSHRIKNRLTPVILMVDLLWEKNNMPHLKHKDEVS